MTEEWWQPWTDGIRVSSIANRYTGDDTKAAAHQSLNCIRNKKNKIWRCDCTLQCGMWLWNRDSEFTKWQHPVMWYVALGWHAIEFARWQHPAMWQVALGWHAIEYTQTSAILEFYIWLRFRPHHHSRHVILHQSPKFYPNWTTLGRKKWCHVDFEDGRSQSSWILGIQ